MAFGVKVLIYAYKYFLEEILLPLNTYNTAMLGFHSQNVPIIIEEDDMKFVKLPLPTNDGGGWTTNVLSTVELITIYNQFKNGQVDGIMIVDSPDYGGRYEQRAISTGFRFNNSNVEFHFSHSYSVDGNQPIGEGFVNDDQTIAIVTVTISSKGILYYQFHSLE